MSIVRCHALLRLHETARHVWVVAVDDVPVGYIQVDNSNVIDVMYVERRTEAGTEASRTRSYRWRRQAYLGCVTTRSSPRPGRRS